VSPAVDRVDLVDLELELERPFRIARGATETTRELVLRVEANGVVGHGSAHASPSVTGETHDEARRALEDVEAADLDPDDVAGSLAAVDGAGPAARAAADLALHDLAGRQRGQPAHELVNLPAGERPSAATITVDDVQGVAGQARRWTERGYATLKLKVDGDSDVLALVDAVREAVTDEMRDPLPSPSLWVDANEALTVDRTRELMPALAEREVTLLEQPLPREEREATLELARQAPVPVVLDEAIQGPEDVRALDGVPGNLGVNVKVQKVGGLRAAAACIEAARATDLGLVVGCNVETGLAVAAGAVLCGAVDHVDLDGNLFRARDPFPLPRPMPGHVGTLASPGLGVHPDPRFVQLDGSGTQTSN